MIDCHLLQAQHVGVELTRHFGAARQIDAAVEAASPLNVPAQDSHRFLE